MMELWSDVLLKLHKYMSFAISFNLHVSRQRYVLGDSAMQQMAKSSIFLSGLGGLGVEIGMCVHVCILSKFLYSVCVTEMSWILVYLYEPIVFA